MQSFAGAVTTSVPACTCTRQQHALRHMDPNLTCSTRAHSTSRPSLASARLPRSQRNRGCTTAVAAAEAALSTNTAAAGLERWLERKGVSLAAAQPQVNGTGAQAHSILAAARNIGSSEIPGDLCVTSADVAAEESVAAAAEGRGELTGLALWLIAERRKGEASPWAALLQSLPQRISTPLLWSEAQLAELLRGSPIADAARQRAAALREEWGAISAAAPDLPADTFSEQAFLDAMTVVLAHAVYLPAAQCFAIAPAVHRMRRSGDPTAAALDYDAGSGAVVLTANRSYGRGQEVALYDGRPNGELLLATGTVQASNPADYLTIEASLVASDRLYQSKKEILDSVGLDNPQEFPITTEGMPVQLLSYLRLARLQNSAEFARVSFEEDMIISPPNEYEVLQLLLADCRDRFTAYGDNMEFDMKMLQRQDLTEEERAAAQLRMEEKRIVGGTMDAVRARLAPIRGIPTKQGNLADPNQDLREIFDAIEGVPNIPKKLFGGFASWARGEQDPDWKKKGKGPEKKRPW